MDKSRPMSFAIVCLVMGGLMYTFFHLTYKEAAFSVVPLLQRTVHHSSGCSKCALGEGHPLSVLTIGYPGGKTRQLSLRPDQVPQVREAHEHYREFKRILEAIGELNQFLLRLDRENS